MILVTAGLRTITKGSVAALLPRFFGLKMCGHENKSNAQTRCGVGYLPMYLLSESDKVRFCHLRAAYDP
eukprot:COSAG01_NODE_277_length_19582_cov_28.126726_2_plen_69_part_00